jgi:hypothetical protein
VHPASRTNLVAFAHKPSTIPECKHPRWRGHPASLQLSKISRIAKLVRLLKLVKMLRLLRLPSLMQQLEDIVGGAMLRFVTFITGALLLIHWTACIFFWVALRYSPLKHSWLTSHSLRNAPLSDK